MSVRALSMAIFVEWWVYGMCVIFDVIDVSDEVIVDVSARALDRYICEVMGLWDVSYGFMG